MLGASHHYHVTWDLNSSTTSVGMSCHDSNDTLNSIDDLILQLEQEAVFHKGLNSPTLTNSPPLDDAFACIDGPDMLGYEKPKRFSDMTRQELMIEADLRRKRNTESARRSRLRKRQALAMLQMQLMEAESHIDFLTNRVRQLEQEKMNVNVALSQVPSL